MRKPVLVNHRKLFLFEDCGFGRVVLGYFCCDGAEADLSGCKERHVEHSCSLGQSGAVRCQRLMALHHLDDLLLHVALKEDSGLNIYAFHLISNHGSQYLRCLVSAPSSRNAK